jgi:gamma-glutamyltranspeptidase/glutathione hydrolase
VNPAGSGIGGGGFLLYAPPKEKQVYALDFRERAPSSATKDMFLLPGLPANSSREGGLAVGVPGEVAGCAEAVKRWGKLPLALVLTPAIVLARDGFRVGTHLAKSLRVKKTELRRWPQFNLVFAAGGEPLEEGVLLRRPRLARALEAIAREGADVFYRGWIAEDIVESVAKAGGILRREDLAAYRPTLRKVLTMHWGPYELSLMPPPSSGGIAFVQTLQILEALEIVRFLNDQGLSTHYLVEAFKHAFADRARFLGDADFVKVPTAYLMSKAYAKALAKRVDAKKTQSIASYGSKEIPPVAGHQDGGTSHLSVIDAMGGAVALTSTINTSFGSYVITSRSGILLNNQMDDFSAQPGKANAFGLLQSERNAIAPHKRPLSSMTPLIVKRDGFPVLSVGASGGPTIITGTFQVFWDILVRGDDPAKAVAAPRIHHQWSPPWLFVEKGFPAPLQEALRQRKHHLFVVGSGFTAVQAVYRTPDGRKIAASDPRKYGEPAAY